MSTPVTTLDQRHSAPDAVPAEWDKTCKLLESAQVLRRMALRFLSRVAQEDGTARLTWPLADGVPGWVVRRCESGLPVVLWCAVFGAVHVFWALGGQTGLASSAGAGLAARRPASFVVFGLWGAALVLAGGAVLAGCAARCPLGTWWLRVLRAAAVVMAIALVLRGVLVEAALVVNLGGVRQSVGPLETHWSLVLWNPWFMIGGACFFALALALHRRLATAGEPP